MDTKQVIVIRKDLKMRRGKEIAQGSHASSAWLIHRTGKYSKEELIWLDRGHTKVCLQVNSEEELLAVYQKAKDAMLTVYLITDSGKTEFDGVPTKTCLAIGPHESSKIDSITKELKLY